MTKPVIGVILDTETTGKEEGAEVLQLAYVEIDDSLRETANACNTYHLPTKGIEWGALATHHLYPERLARQGATSERAVPPIADYYIGHNIDFDWKMLGSPPGVRRICTLALARYHWSDTQGHSLGACTYRISADFESTEARLRNAHNALADVSMCLDLLHYFSHHYNCKDLHSLWLLSEHARIPTVMPFGKHKGERIADVPRHYKLWALKQPDFDEYVLLAFRASL